MVSIFYKWLFVAVITMFSGNSGKHPIYVSVTEIEHNAREKSLEVSCKLFTDDFEKTLRMAYRVHIDLLKPGNKALMNSLVDDYIQKHLKISIDGKTVQLKFIGYEEIEEGIYSYFEATGIERINELVVMDNLLYEYKKEQISLLHVLVNGSRKSSKLNNPDAKAIFSF